MSDEGATATTTAPQPAHGRRRSSFAELFANRPPNDPSSIINSMSVGSTSPRPARPSQSYMMAATSGDNHGSSQPSAGSASSGQQVHPRRLSITTLGLSGSPTRTAAAGGTSPFAALRRGQSTSETEHRRSFDNYESAVADEVDSAGGEASSVPKNSPPFARRVSFGARAAYREMRAGSISSVSGNGGGGGGSGGGGANGNGNGGAGNRSPSNGSVDPLSATTSNENGSSNGTTKISTSPPSSSFKERFNWSENIRARAERSSISSGAGISFGSAFGSSGKVGHTRSPSGSAVAAGSGGAAMTGGVPASAPAAPVPRVAPDHKAPDHFQERILKGDFYMD